MFLQGRCLGLFLSVRLKSIFFFILKLFDSSVQTASLLNLFRYSVAEIIMVSQVSAMNTMNFPSLPSRFAGWQPCRSLARSLPFSFSLSLSLSPSLSVPISPPLPNSTPRSQGFSVLGIPLQRCTRLPDVSLTSLIYLNPPNIMLVVHCTKDRVST